MNKNNMFIKLFMEIILIIMVELLRWIVIFKFFKTPYNFKNILYDICVFFIVFIIYRPIQTMIISYINKSNNENDDDDED